MKKLGDKVISTSYLPLRTYIEYLNTLTADSVERLRDLASPQLHFRDPFNDVASLEETLKIFHKMFEDVQECEFTVLASYGREPHFVIEWEYSFRNRWIAGGQRSSFPGLSKLCFDSVGKVIEHIDYWDSGVHFYGKLPILRPLIDRIRKRVSANL